MQKSLFSYPCLFVAIDAKFQIHITLQKAYLLENLCFFGNFGIVKHITELILKRTCNHPSDRGSIFEIDKDFHFQEILILQIMYNDSETQPPAIA